MKTPYDVKQWAAGTTRGRQVFNFNYRMLGSEFKGWTLVKVVTMQEGDDAKEEVYVWQNTADPKNELFRVNVTERHNWRQAQESLHGHLTQCMRPDIPKGTKKVARLGDINFTGREAHTDVLVAISFSRGNVCVSVISAGGKTVDVSDIAERLDTALSEPPAKRDVEKGKVRALTPITATVKANEACVLIKDLQKAAPRGEWLKIIVPDGELNRKGAALIYTSAQGGKKKVGAFAVGQAP